MARANELRAAEGRPPIRAHVTPHTFRRTYITYMVAAGYDLPYVQAQVGHDDPSVTLSIYAQALQATGNEEEAGLLARSACNALPTSFCIFGGKA